MEIKKFLIISALVAVFSFVSCGTTNGAAPAATAAVFAVSEELYLSTMEEVRLFIENLNRVIRTRNFETWRTFLSPEYFERISSEEHLREISEMPAMRRGNITLRSAQDFFNYVVVPSRANSRLDDIEFITENRVQAFTIHVNARGEQQRLRLYDLEKINNMWTIIN